MDAHNVETMSRTMVTAISGGALLILVSRWLRIPGIVLLLIGGIALGPVGLGIVRADSLGQGLSVIVSLSVGLILFEGGLTLNVEGYRASAGMIRRILTIGVATTWLATAAAVHLIMGLDYGMSLLAGSMVIVTGPTVIGPILKRIRIKPRLHAILHWEGVLIDPIGVFLAIVCIDWVTGHGHEAALTNFVARVLVGLSVGTGGGLAIYYFIRSRLVPEDMTNLSALAGAMLVFGVSQLLSPESGLLAVTIAGFLVGMKQPAELKQIRQFKSEITDLAIGMLFILLASRLEFEQFQAFGWRGALLIVAMILVVRPLNVLLSSIGFDLSWREQAFLSWMAPRGIVAASMASLFSLRLEEQGVADARFLETFTYSVIVATVLLQGISAGLTSRLLGVDAPVPKGWLIVGAHGLGRRVAVFLRDVAGVPVQLIDTNPRAVAEARQMGLEVLAGDARDIDGLRYLYERAGIGNVLAITDNEDLNAVLCQRWAEVVGRDHVFRWSPGQRTELDPSPGMPIWPRLPKPSIVSGELARGDATLTTTRVDGVSRDLALMTAAADRIFLDPQEAPASNGQSGPQALVLSRATDPLIRSINPQLVFEGDAETLEELFTQMLDRVAVVEPRVPRDQMVQELLEREAVVPTTLGHGVAIPHAYSRHLERRLCAVTRLRKGIDFGASDGEPVRLVFLLLSPPGDPEGHLATIADIARIVVEPHRREDLLSAPIDQLIDRIRAHHLGGGADVTT